MLRGKNTCTSNENIIIKSSLPLCVQVVGFTASLGVGKVNALDNAVEHLKTFLAIMDADCLVTVQRNKQDLATHVNNPKQCNINYHTTVH